MQIFKHDRVCSLLVYDVSSKTKFTMPDGYIPLSNTPFVFTSNIALAGMISEKGVVLIPDGLTEASRIWGFVTYITR